jgi:hypothetical protein
MNENPSSSNPQAADMPGDTGHSSSRRKLLRGGLAVGPVVVASAVPRSVMAGECVPASSFASINASRPAEHIEYSCQFGRTPGYWKQSQWFSQWPSPFLTTTLFNDVFKNSPGYPGKTLLQVLQLMGGGRDAVARHIVAALLNAKKGWTPAPVAGVTIVKQVWKAYDLNGYYNPTAGINWYHDYSVPGGLGGILPWLKSTMPL